MPLKFMMRHGGKVFAIAIMLGALLWLVDYIAPGIFG